MKPASALALCIAASCLAACTTGKIYTTGSQRANGFSYAIPETIIKVDIPVKYWAKGTTENGKFQPKNGTARLDPDETAPPVITFDFDGHPTPLSVVVMDQANNTTALDKFEVAYYTTGEEGNLRSSGVIHTINSEASDKVADTIKAVTETAGQVIKIAAAFGLQSGAAEESEVLLKEHIRIAVRLRSGQAAIKKQFDGELARIGALISGLPSASVLTSYKGIQGVTLSDDLRSTWPDRITQEYVAKRLRKEGTVTNDSLLTKLKTSSQGEEVEVINGIVYPDAQPARFTLTVKVDDKSYPIYVTAQVPEAGSLRVLPLNPKFFGKRKLAATFARNGKLSSWSYSSESRAANAATFGKEEAGLVNTIVSDAVARRAKAEQDEATENQKNTVEAVRRRTNSSKLNDMITAKQRDLNLATLAETQATEAATLAEQAYLDNKDETKKAALLTAKNSAQLAKAKAENDKSTAEADLKALKNKESDVRRGLIDP